LLETPVTAVLSKSASAPLRDHRIHIPFKQESELIVRASAPDKAMPKATKYCENLIFGILANPIVPKEGTKEKTIVESWHTE